ncbi:histone H1-like [Belonocnema kinseyi]|uniref:histone H1-like n=1 Tax=Belonocnema kinseyi TaxID=2817044 RepID=UPI00143D4A2E|nr:histone H1-like [Belonocnema kinseyi]
MTDKVVSAVPVVATPKKVAVPKMAKPKTKPSHPSTADMVNAAIKELKERNGSSLQAIKKYIAVTYKVDTDKLAPFIRKYLKSAVASGKLVQRKGKGASGSFKLAVKDSKPKAVKSAASKVAKKSASLKKAAPKAKKTVGEKKKSPKVAAKPPKAKSTTAKPKVTKASPKKVAKAASLSKKVTASKSKKPVVSKKVAKK